jgi:hypothetical protein
MSAKRELTKTVVRDIGSFQKQRKFKVRSSKLKKEEPGDLISWLFLLITLAKIPFEPARNQKIRERGAEIVLKNKVHRSKFTVQG